MSQKSMKAINKMTKEKLEKIDFKNVVYAEWSTAGAMGVTGNFVIYYIKNKELKAMATNIFSDEQLYTLGKEIITKNQSHLIFGKPAFGNYFCFGNNFVKHITAQDQNLICEYDNKKFKISCSVHGVFTRAVRFLQYLNLTK